MPHSLTLGRVIQGFVALALALLVAGCGESQIPLYRNLSEREANRLVAFLAGHNVMARKLLLRDGVQVTVPADQMADASRLLVAGGLPREEYKGLGAVFQKDGLISSPLEERARLTFATAQQIESMLMEIDGVVSARANIVIPERRNGRVMDPAAAAILIRHEAGLETDVLEMKVRRLVAASVPGLVDGEARHISVSFLAVDGTGNAGDPVLPAVTSVVGARGAESAAVAVTATHAPSPSGMLDAMAWMAPLLVAGIGFALWHFSDRLSAAWARRRQTLFGTAPKRADT